jgi:hypothetical protein
MNEDDAFEADVVKNINDVAEASFYIVRMRNQAQFEKVGDKSSLRRETKER